MNENNVIDTFIIHGNVPSSKNSRVWTGKFFVKSKATQKWMRDTKKEWKQQAIWFRYLTFLMPEPYYIELTFYRKNWQKFDYINAAQIVFDQMADYSWIEDDQADIVHPFFGQYTCDPGNPRVVIKLLKTKPPVNDLPSFH